MTKAEVEQSLGKLFLGWTDENEVIVEGFFSHVHDAIGHRGHEIEVIGPWFRDGRYGGREPEHGRLPIGPNAPDGRIPDGLIFRLQPNAA